MIVEEFLKQEKVVNDIVHQSKTRRVWLTDIMERYAKEQLKEYSRFLFGLDGVGVEEQEELIEDFIKDSKK